MCSINLAFFSVIQPKMNVSASYFMEAGHWFLSIYNDDNEKREMAFTAQTSPELTKNCPKGCNGKGECVLGRCQCETGYDGPDCGQSKFDPTLFSYQKQCCLVNPTWGGGWLKAEATEFFRRLFLDLFFFLLEKLVKDFFFRLPLVRFLISWLFSFKMTLVTNVSPN